VARVDFEAEGLLDDLEDEDARRARLDLLRELDDDGVSVEEMRHAIEEGRLAMLPVERVLGGRGEYTQAEAAEKAGVPAELLQEQRRAVGLPPADPDDRVFTDVDVKAIQEFNRFLEAGMPYEKLAEVSRVIGESMARISDAAGRLVGETFLRAGDTERDAGLRYAQAAQELGPIMATQLQYVFRLHMTEQVRSYVVGQAELASGELPGSQEVTVCFADLVGFTKLGERLPPDDVGKVARQLRDMAGDAVNPPARLVKTIGDAAMLVAPEPQPVVDAALSLVETADSEGEEFPPVHAGVACGSAIGRAGDWYGQPVNLASRVTNIARPGAVLTTSEVRKTLGDGYRWSAAGRRRVKGVKQPVSLWRVRRDGGESG
jgi:adenylate cyclase